MKRNSLENKTEKELKTEKFARALKASLRDMKKFELCFGDNIVDIFPKVPY